MKPEKNCLHTKLHKMLQIYFIAPLADQLNSVLRVGAIEVQNHGALVVVEAPFCLLEPCQALENPSFQAANYQLNGISPARRIHSQKIGGHRSVLCNAIN